MKYAVSDLHFSHKRIIEYCSRPFKTVEEMEAALIANWNTKVQNADDEVFVLGDVAFCRADHLARILDRLNGIKYLVKGNHDKQAVIEPALSKWAWVENYHELWYQDNQGPNRTGKKWFFTMGHYPLLTWNGQGRGSVNLCGHRHLPGAPDRPKICSECKHQDRQVRRYDVGVDANNYAPVALTEIIDRVKDIPFGWDQYKED